MSTTPFWKKVHQTVSGYSQNITDDIVEEILKLSKNDLLEGLLCYKAYSRKGYDEWTSKVDVSSYMKEFIHELSQDLNLDTEVAYTVMCNYLMFEYYGKIKEFWQITRIGTTVHLKENIWNFYTAERMFLLKTWRHILENLSKGEFHQQYEAFLKALELEELQNKLIKQFEEVTNEISNFDDHKYYSENWLCRNAREQNEILLILTLTIEQRDLNPKQINQLVMLFIQNNFGTTSPTYKLTTLNRDLEELMYAEIGCFFVILQNYWDCDMTNFWKESSTKELNDCLTGLYLNSGHALVVLAWLILKFKSFQSEGDSARIIELFNKQPFLLLESLVSAQMFKGCSVGDIVLKACHKMLDELCLMFDDRKILYEQSGMIGTLSEFLKNPELVEICSKARNGLDTLLEIAIEAFPYDFLSFTKISESLLMQKNHYKQTIHLLNNIPSFLSDMTWSIPKEEISVLQKSQSAFHDSDLIVFPPSTIVRSYRIFSKNLVQYRNTYTYFSYLEYLINSLINEGVAQRRFDPKMVEKVVAGYQIILNGIKYCTDMDLKIIGIDRIIQKYNKILLHLDGLLLNFELVKTYFQVQNYLVVFRRNFFFCNCPDVVLNGFFPKLRSELDDVKKLLFNQYIFDDNVFMKLFHEEEFRDDHDLLLTYLDLLTNIMKMKFQHRNFQLSGIAYLLNFVFMQHQTWVYRDENQKTRITLACLNLFHFILQKDYENLKEQPRKIFDLCQHALLNNTYIIECFLRLFIKEKYYLIFVMERESNWLLGCAVDKLKCIRMQLALLLLIMNQRRTYGKCALDERLPYVVKPVASYFTNSYSPVIAELSCRFLDKLAQDQFVPLLALLELDHYQVQSLFLERLRDPLEEEKVKIAIIDLINTCVSTQNGMTAAFFNLKCFMYWDGNESDVFKGDSVSEFMIDYLQNIKKSHEYFKNPLQLGILRLIYNLWITHRENLIENIAKLKDFWPVMVDPFFCDFVQDLEVYVIILKIVNLEISTSSKDTLKNIFEKFLKDFKRLEDWIRFVLKSSSVYSKNNLDLVSAWTEFVVITKKILPHCYPDSIREIFIDSCLQGVNIREGGFNNIEIVYYWSQLYLILSTTWPLDISRQKTILFQLTRFLQSLNAYYKYLPASIKEIILCIIYRTVVDFESFFEKNYSSLLAFLNAIGTLFDTEYEYLDCEVWHIEDEGEKIKRLKPWLIIVSIGNSLLVHDENFELGIWYHYHKFLKRVLDSTVRMLQHKATLSFAKLAIDFIISYSQSAFVEDFLLIDLFTFYYKIKPQINLTINASDVIMMGLPPNLKEWWLIFISLIKLNRILIRKLGKAILNTCFSFITEHDKNLREFISLTKYTVDMTALTLACESLKLIHLIISLIPDWYVVHEISYLFVMDGIKTTINASVLSILGYKKIVFYECTGDQLTIIHSTPNDLLITVLNKLTEIIYWGASVLRKTKPDPMLPSISPIILEHITIFVENDFSVPRFELPITSKLTYGTLLCLADYLCKTLNQLSRGASSPTPRSREISLSEVQDELKHPSLGKILEYCTDNYETCIGFMIYLQRSDDLPNEKLSSFLHYDMTEFSGSSSTISHLDYYSVKNSLEALMSFLACEIFYTMRNFHEEILFAYKRELSSEIQFFYEFVRKRTSEQYNTLVSTPKTMILKALTQNETDIIKKYMITKVTVGEIDDIVDNNFILVISQWLINICHLSN